MAPNSTSRCEMLSQDLVFQILLFLPVASLLRCKAVCKSWLSLIESSDFISQHTHHSNSEDNQENKLIIWNSDYVPDSTHKFISVIDLLLSTHVDFKLNTDEKNIGADLVASFNGIICLTHVMRSRECITNESVGEAIDFKDYRPLVDEITVVSLWNPATKHVKILPPPLGGTGLVTHGSDYDSRIDYGFGFDVKTNDYRVVRVIVEELNTKSKVLKSHVQVYSLNMDSWRVIDAVVPVKIVITSHPRRPSKNGSYCWLGWDYISHGPVILSFNFSNEVFGIIPVKEVFGVRPMSVYQDRKIIAFLREKLACIHWVRESSEIKNCHFKIWELNNCGVKESWTNIYNITLEPKHFPIHFSVNGKMVLSESENGRATKLCLFDLATQECIDTPYQRTFSEVAVYKESLVSVKGAIGESYRVDSKWKAISSAWDPAVSRMIMGSNERFAGILSEDASGLILFDEPKTVPLAQTILPTHWSPPLAGTIKLNTYAIWDFMSLSDLGTFGWVARNAAGVAVKAACSNPIPMIDFLDGKAEAVRNALCGASCAGWDSIIIESDCYVLVERIKGSMIKGSSDEDSTSRIIADIINLSARFKSISFCYVPRSLNSAALSLARHGFMCDRPYTWVTVMPDWLNDVLAEDLVS